MINDKNLERRIADVLTIWNPIGVPNFIVEDEYRPYIETIISIGKNPEKLKSYLVHLATETLGLGYDEKNQEHQRDIENITKELIQAF